MLFRADWITDLGYPHVAKADKRNIYPTARNVNVARYGLQDCMYAVALEAIDVLIYGTCSGTSEAGFTVAKSNAILLMSSAGTR